MCVLTVCLSQDYPDVVLPGVGPDQPAREEQVRCLWGLGYCRIWLRVVIVFDQWFMFSRVRRVAEIIKGLLRHSYA